MERGHRSIFRKCLCGCGRHVPPKINKKTGRVKHYPPYITGHGAGVLVPQEYPSKFIFDDYGMRPRRRAGGF